MNQPTFRQGNADDVNIVVHLFSQIFDSESDEDYKSQVANFLEYHPDKLIWLVECDDQAIGIAVTHGWNVFPKPGKTDRVYWHLANFYLVKRCRNQRIGEQFLEYILDQARQKSVEKIIVYAGGEFGGFFLRNGFTQENNILQFKP